MLSIKFGWDGTELVASEKVQKKFLKVPFFFSKYDFALVFQPLDRRVPVFGWG